MGWIRGLSFVVDDILFDGNGDDQSMFGIAVRKWECNAPLLQLFLLTLLVIVMAVTHLQLRGQGDEERPLIPHINTLATQLPHVTIAMAEFISCLAQDGMCISTTPMDGELYAPALPSPPNHPSQPTRNEPQIFTCCGSPISSTSTPSFNSLLDGIFPRLINSAHLLLTGSICIVATATTVSPLA